MKTNNSKFEITTSQSRTIKQNALTRSLKPNKVRYKTETKIVNNSIRKRFASLILITTFVISLTVPNGGLQKFDYQNKAETSLSQSNNKKAYNPNGLDKESQKLKREKRKITKWLNM